MSLTTRITGRDLSGTEVEILATIPSDTLTAAGIGGMMTNSIGLNYDEATSRFEFERSNITRTVLSSANRSANATSSLITNPSCRGAMFFLDITSAFPGSGSTTVALVVQARDPVGGRFVTIATGTQQSASGTSLLVVYPGISASANGVAQPLPREFQVIGQMSTGATSKDVTFSIGMQFIK